MLSATLTATVNLLLFRTGPQEFPYSGRFSSGLIAAAGVAIALSLSLAIPGAAAIATALATLGGLAAGSHAVLRVRRLDNRFQQTFHSLVATTAIFNLMLLWPFAEFAPALEQAVDATQKGVAPEQAQANLPMLPFFLIMVLQIWGFAVRVFIFRHAADVSVTAAVLIAFLVDFAVGSFALLMMEMVLSATGAGGGAVAPAG